MLDVWGSWRNGLLCGRQHVGSSVRLTESGSKLCSFIVSSEGLPSLFDSAGRTVLSYYPETHD